jgi:hypothetical protein
MGGRGELANSDEFINGTKHSQIRSDVAPPDEGSLRVADRK